MLSPLPVLVARGAVAPDTAGAVYELGWGRLLGVAGVAAAGRSALGALVHAEVLVAARTLADLAQTHPRRILALAGGLMNAVITHPVALRGRGRAGSACHGPESGCCGWLSWAVPSRPGPRPRLPAPGRSRRPGDVLVLHYLTALCHHPGAALLVGAEDSRGGRVPVLGSAGTLLLTQELRAMSALGPGGSRLLDWILCQDAGSSSASASGSTSRGRGPRLGQAALRLETAAPRSWAWSASGLAALAAPTLGAALQRRPSSCAPGSTCWWP